MILIMLQEIKCKSRQRKRDVNCIKSTNKNTVLLSFFYSLIPGSVRREAGQPTDDTHRPPTSNPSRRPSQGGRAPVCVFYWLAPPWLSLTFPFISPFRHPSRPSLPFPPKGRREERLQTDGFLGKKGKSVKETTREEPIKGRDRDAPSDRAGAREPIFIRGLYSCFLGNKYCKLQNLEYIVNYY